MFVAARVYYFAKVWLSIPFSLFACFFIYGITPELMHILHGWL